MSSWSRSLALAILAATPSLAAPAETQNTGSMCIAAFQPDPHHGPVMDLPAPGPDSVYSFRVDRRGTEGLKASVTAGQRGTILGVPADRPVLVEVALDGKPTESFRVDLGSKEGRRLCLELYRGYWHWVDAFNERRRGCTCWDPPAD
jgi:hypothetical protein